MSIFFTHKYNKKERKKKNSIANIMWGGGAPKQRYIREVRNKHAQGSDMTHEHNNYIFKHKLLTMRGLAVFAEEQPFAEANGRVEIKQNENEHTK